MQLAKDTADELARLRAEVRKHALWAMEAQGRAISCEEIMEAAISECDELRRRIAETQTTRVLAAPGGCWVECGVPSGWVGSVVALVRLDAEEGK